MDSRSGDYPLFKLRSFKANRTSCSNCKPNLIKLSVNMNHFDLSINHVTSELLCDISSGRLEITEVGINNQRYEQG